MATHEESKGQVERRMRELAGGLAALRQHPCLLFVSSTIHRQDLVTLRKGLGNQQGEHLDVIVASPGGEVGAAYLVARELRRHFGRLTVYVPLQAKSAATLLCLAAEELVLGPLGELGPLDQQYDEKQQADFPLSTSRLVPFQALEQLQRLAAGTYDELVGRILDKSGMRPFEACSKAAELTSSLYGPLYAQVDPIRIAECARGLELGTEYALRLLRRYRPELEGKQTKKIVHALVHAYPSHGFILDLEELAEFGLPARAPEAEEFPFVDELALALVEYGTDWDLIDLVPAPVVVAKMRRALPAQQRGELEVPARSKQGTRGDRRRTRNGLRARARVREVRHA